MSGDTRRIRFTLTTSATRLFISLLSFICSIPIQASGQSAEAKTAIQNLHQGVLIVRFPFSRAKIDTLNALIGRAEDDASRAKWQKILNRTTAERDTLVNAYTQAFRDNYTFSKVAWFHDYDAHDLKQAEYFNLNGEQIPLSDLDTLPKFYCHFDRTTESKMDALVLYDQQLRKPARPFPNDFSRTGVNILFLKISDKNFPAWRVSKINKALFKYYHAVMIKEIHDEE